MIHVEKLTNQFMQKFNAMSQDEKKQYLDKMGFQYQPNRSAARQVASTNAPSETTKVPSKTRKSRPRTAAYLALPGKTFRKAE